MAEGDHVDVSEEVNPSVPTLSQPPQTHAPPPLTPAGVLPAYPAALPTHLLPPASSGAPLPPASPTSAATNDQARIAALEGTNVEAPALPTLYTSTVHPFTTQPPPPPAPSVVPLPPATFLSSEHILSAPPPVSMPAPAVAYTVPQPMVFPASTAPAPTHPQATKLPPFPSLQPHAGLSYQAPPPINTTFHEPGTPTHAAQFASPTHFFLEADAEQERRLKRMEETIRALQANDNRPDARYGDCSLFPGMRLPPKFKVPEFKTYDGKTDPRHHLRHYRGKMLQYWEYEEFAEDIPTWEDLSRKFTDQYRYCAETPPTLLELSTKEMARGQKFAEYAAKWRAQAVKHIPPISEAQQIQLFHSTLRGVYYSHLLAHTSSFSDLIEAGKKLDLEKARKNGGPHQQRRGVIKEGSRGTVIFQREESERSFGQRRQYGTLGATTIFGESHDRTDHRSYLLPPASTAPISVDLLFSPTGPTADDLTVIRPLCACPRSALSTQAPGVENSSTGATKSHFAGSTGRRRAKPTPQTILAAACSSLSHISATLGGKSNSTDIPVFELRPSPTAKDKGKAPAVEDGATPESSPFPSKKVTEEEAEAFMKIVKASEYKVVEQMAKSPAHISLLALLLGSEPHREALLRVLTAAQVPKETPPDRIEETIGSIFSNTISFSDDELPSEGWSHSRALHIVCKCNNYIIGRVMIDNESALNVCPVTILKQMNVDLNRVRPSKTAVRAFDGSRREVLLRNNYIPGTGLGARGQGISRPVEIEEYKHRRGLGFRPSCHEIIEARKGNHLHRLAAYYGRLNRGTSVPPLSHFFPGPSHTIGGTLDGPSSDSDDTPATSSAVYAVTEEIPSGVHIRLAQENEELDNWTSVPRYSVVIADQLGEPQPVYFGEGLPEDGQVPEIEESLRRLEDHQITSVEPTEEINVGTKEEPRTLKIGTALDPTQRTRMIDFLKGYQEVFAWSYADMLGLDPSIVEHFLPLNTEKLPPKRQQLRRQRASLLLRIKEEVVKKINAGFLECTFNARSGKLLGFVVSERGIEVDPDKVKAIKELPPPSTVRETEDVLATLASMASISEGNIVEPLVIEVARRPAHCNEIEASEAKPWYEDIKNFMQMGHYPPSADRRDRKTLRHLAMHYFLSGEILYHRSFDSTLLRCIDEHESRRLMEEVHGGNCGPHMNGLMLAKKIMRLGYYWSTMETDCVKHVRHCHRCQVYADQIKAPPNELRPMTAPWPFSMWGILDVIARYGVPATIITDNAKNLNNKVLHVTPDSRGKFSYKYDSPFVVKEVFSGGAVILSDMDSTENALPVNADAIKKSKTPLGRPRQKLEDPRGAVSPGRGNRSKRQKLEDPRGAVSPGRGNRSKRCDQEPQGTLPVDGFTSASCGKPCARRLGNRRGMCCTAQIDGVQRKDER
ncbi:hypothetical protein CRG98_003705 [Punica granatum]|uniref:G-patch domain-containing protein n=1 Tax=Punica granatum TaxID=22663 RepID=A0A2I0L715_PUNGR|nr:hypothetical protein CRG98_003705 [Punica granatum]